MTKMAIIKSIFSLKDRNFAWYYKQTNYTISKQTNKVNEQTKKQTK